MLENVCRLIDGLEETAVDLMDNQVAEQQLSASERKFGAIFENCGDALVVSQAGLICLTNKAFRDMFGFTDENTVLGRSITSIVAPESRYLVAKYMKRRLLDSVMPTFYDCKGLRCTGSEFDLEIKVSNYCQNGEFFTLATLRDISLRKRVADSLQKSRNFHLSLFEESPALILLCAPDGKLIYLNKAWRQFIGGHTGHAFELRGKDIIHIDDLDHIKHQYIRALEEGLNLKFEARFLRQDGEYRWLASLGKPFQDSNGNLDGYLINSFDITEIKNQK